MPLDPDDPGLLYNMMEAAEAVVRFVANRTRADYAADELLRAGVERKIEIIGEACRGISKAFRESHPDIAWEKISATRHILAHEYDRIDEDVIWRIATVHVPELLVQLRPLVPSPPPDPQPEPEQGQ